MIRMLHKHCGGHIATAVDPNFCAIPGMLVQSNDFILVETGRRPINGSPIMCPKCHKQVAIREVTFEDDDTEEVCPP